jgi:exopolysaccharide biosynthesis polyprenyl glycosylphosphotransferase
MRNEMTDVVAGATPRVRSRAATPPPVEHAPIHAAAPVVSLPARTVVARRRTYLVIAAVVLDLVAVLVAYTASRALQVDGWHLSGATLPQGRALLLSVPLWILTVAAYGLYGRDRRLSASEEMRRLFHAVTVSLMLTVVLVFVIHEDVSRLRIASLTACGLVALSLSHLFMRQLAGKLATSGVLPRRLVIVGGDAEARNLTRAIGHDPALGYRVVGTRDPHRAPAEEVAALVAATDADTVMIAGSAVGPDTLLALDRALQPLDVDVQITPGLPHVAATRVRMSPLDGGTVLHLQKQRFTRHQAIVKRFFDVVVGSVAFVVSLPVQAGVALAVLISSGRPIFFRQERIGAGGEPFTIVKFRTMKVDAEEELEALLSANDADGPLFKLRDDPRSTPIGRRLRTSGLDELPQLWNVLKGEMSLVGPRPALPRETAEFSDEARDRLRVKPGLTGLWQVKRTHELTFEAYVHYDVFYVENWSLTFDLYVIAKTIPALLRRRGAY